MMEMKNPVEEIALADIFLDRDTQIRVSTSEETIQRYFDVMIDENARDSFPPILLLRDHDGRMWLVDGHHRVMAAKRRKFTMIKATIMPGTKEDAIWEAIKANSQNGLPLGRADIRRAVIMVLEVLPHKSTTAIADAVGCSQSYVVKIKNQVITSDNLAESEPVKIEGKDGKMYSSRRKRNSNKKTCPDEPVSSAKTQSSETSPDHVVVDLASEPWTEPKITAIQGDADEIKCRRIEADTKEQSVIAATNLLQQRLEEWFAVAPCDMHEGFAKRNRERIEALIC